MALVIEFAGLPGSGKTTIATLVQSKLREQHVKVLSGRQERIRKFGDRKLSLGRFGLFVRHLVQNPDVVWLLARYLGHTRQFHLAALRRAVVLLDRWSIASNASSARDIDYVIFDECLCQAVWALTVGPSRPSLRWLEELVPMLTADVTYGFVFVTSDIDTVLDRVQRRGSTQSRFDTLGVSQLRGVLESSVHPLETIARWFRNSSVGYLYLDATEDLEVNACKVVEWARGLGHGSQ